MHDLLQAMPNWLALAILLFLGWIAWGWIILPYRIARIADATEEIAKALKEANEISKVKPDA